ncbi:MFS transporter [Actinomadura vinacea]|uniref:MFS transporter n=1 Tax=Actinomadura vinacea TaxID=115336 RepID=UPI0031D4FF67
MRAASFAGTCAGLATLGHVAGGGSLARTATLAGFLLVLVPALALTGRERTLASILPATALSQIVLHVLLTEAGGPGSSADAITGTGEMHHGGVPGLGMLLMHAVSVLVTSAWLEWGEARLCALVRLLLGWALRPLLFLLSARRNPAGHLPIAPARANERVPALAVLRYAVVRRGPPRTWEVPGTAMRSVVLS